MRWCGTGKQSSKLGLRSALPAIHALCQTNENGLFPDCAMFVIVASNGPFVPVHRHKIDARCRHAAVASYTRWGNDCAENIAIYSSCQRHAAAKPHPLSRHWIISRSSIAFAA